MGPPESDACTPVAIVTVALPLPPAANVTVKGEKLHVALAGKPEHASETVDANPNFDVRLTVEVAEPPLVTVALAGVNAIAKDGVPTVTLNAVEVDPAKLASPPYLSLIHI